MQLKSAKKMEHLGITFYVGPRTPFPGIGWAVPRWDHLMRPNGFVESQGAFYNDCEDHPEGAEAWAEAACRTYIEKEIQDV